MDAISFVATDATNTLASQGQSLARPNDKAIATKQGRHV